MDFDCYEMKIKIENLIFHYLVRKLQVFIMKRMTII